MKSLLLVALGLLLISSVASAELILDTDESSTRAQLDACVAPILITQSASQPTTLSTTGGVFTCGNVLYSYVTEGYELRKFSPYWDNGIVDPISIKSIEWGVRRYVATDSILPAGTVILPYNDADGPLMVDVIVYKINANDAFLFANLVQITTQQVEIPKMVPPALLYDKVMHTDIIANCNYDPQIDPDVWDLVVAIHNPATYNMINPVRFACAAMANAETAESYTAWPGGCPASFEPSTPTELGSPGASKFALNVCAELCAPVVNGACCNLLTGACTVTPAADCTFTWTTGVECSVQLCPIPVPAENKSWGQVKSLYR
jgi:hypothetical protein